MTAAVTTTPGLDWRRLSVRMLLVHPVTEAIRALPVIFGLLIAGSARGHGGAWSLVGVGLAIALGLLRWWTTRYRITTEHIEIQRGLLNKRVVTVPRDRVRSVDVTAHVLHRVLGLARVAVGTGESDRQRHSALVLDGMGADEAAHLRDELLHNRGAAVVDAPAPVHRETVLTKLSPAWIFYGPFTLSGLVTIGVVLAFAWRTVNEGALESERRRALHWFTGELTTVPIGVTIAVTVVGSVILIAVLSTLAYVLAFWNFKLTRSEGGTLHIARGLLTTRATTIEERRLRGVELSEPLLLRAVRAARCIAITTGLRVGRGAERGGSLIVPPAPRAEALRVGGAVLGESTPLSIELTRHPRAALRRRLLRALVGATVFIGLSALLGWAFDAAGAWAAVAAIIFGPAAVLLAIDRYRSLGHAVVDRWVVFRVGSLVRRRSALTADGIIGFTMRQSFFQRRSGLVSLTATTAAGRQRYELMDVRGGTAVAIADAIMPGLITPFLAAPQTSEASLSSSSAAQAE